jgi:hypothetical protein
MVAECSGLFECGPETEIRVTGTGAELSSGSMTAGPATVGPGGAVSATSITRCPSEATSVQVSMVDGDGTALASKAGVLNSAGNWAATIIVPGTAARGAYFVTAQCSGNFHIQDYNYVPVTVGDNDVATRTTLTSSATLSSYTQPVTFTATVTAQRAGTTPTGLVTFTDGSTTLGTVPVASDGIARMTTSTLSVRTHTITATYGGDARPSSADRMLTVQRAATSLSPTPAHKTANTVFSATLATSYAPAANETVTFTVPSGLSTKTMCTAISDANGVATCTATNPASQWLLVSSYTAKYAGSADFLPATAKGTVR